MEKDKSFYKNYSYDDISELDKKELLNNSELVLGLAKWNRNFAKTKFANELEILKLCDGEIAWWLARYSGENGWGKSWSSQQLDVLKLCNGEVAWQLAISSDDNDWARRPAAQDKEVLALCDEKIALELARRFPGNGWGESFVRANTSLRSLCNGKVGKEIDGVILHLIGGKPDPFSDLRETIEKFRGSVIKNR